MFPSKTRSILRFFAFLLHLARISYFGCMAVYMGRWGPVTVGLGRGEGPGDMFNAFDGMTVYLACLLCFTLVVTFAFAPRYSYARIISIVYSSS